MKVSASKSATSGSRKTLEETIEQTAKTDKIEIKIFSSYELQEKV